MTSPPERAALSVWLDDQGLNVGDVSSELVEPSFEGRREACVAKLRTRWALLPMVRYLRRPAGSGKFAGCSARPVELLIDD